MNYFPPPKPWSTHEEQLIDFAIQSALSRTPEQALREVVRSNLFPPRFGYDRTQPTLDFVLNMDSQAAWAQNRRYDFSGTQAEISSSSRNVGAGTW